MIRLFQPDVWENKNNWGGFFLSAVEDAYEEWKQGEPPRVILLPDAAEYTDRSSVYAQLRSKSSASSDGCASECTDS